MSSPAAKRRRLESPSDRLAAESGVAASTRGEARSMTPLNSLHRDISPPRRKQTDGFASKPDAKGKSKAISSMSGERPESEGKSVHSRREHGFKAIKSPFQLTRIRDLPASHNVDTVSLSELIGDPLTRELWLFDYLYDVDFVMQHLDPDVRSLVSVKIVHGSWKKEDGHRIQLEQQAKKYANVQLLCAHMPEAFGTHHSKMMAILKHDDTAEVVIHTANMISQDWANLTQGVWRSSPLPLLDPAPDEDDSLPSGPIGSGHRFKSDLLRYLREYRGRTKTLVQQLRLYDFSSVRAAFLASAPSRQATDTSQSSQQTAFGWPGLRQILSQIPCMPSSTTSAPNIVVQISSVATLSEKWLTSLLFVLSTSNQDQTQGRTKQETNKPSYSIIFPTAAEVRRSLDGYAAGASIHMKLHSAAQQRQLALLRPMLCHWSGSDTTSPHPQPPPPFFHPPPAGAAGAAEPEAPLAAGHALRARAAPHIKTYIRFADRGRARIDWALLTSANLSQQAWGGLPSGADGTVRVASYEVGVVVWPGLFVEGADEGVRMVPVFGRDEVEMRTEGDTNAGTAVGLRMPYDLPLSPYKREEVPWCASAVYKVPDWRGAVWGVEAEE